MSDLRLDEDGDLLIDNGDAVLVDGLAAIGQHVAMRLRSFVGEWFLNLNAGVPYFQEVLEKGTPATRLRAIFQEIILGTDGVASIESMELDYDGATRILTVTFDATTEAGEDLPGEEEITI